MSELASQDTTRNALTGVLLEHKGDKVRIVASDARMLGVLTVQNRADAFPETAGMKGAPNGATSALVDADAFAKMCKAVPRKSVTTDLGVQASATAVTMCGVDSVKDGETLKVRSENVSVQKPVEGKFPDFDSIMGNYTSGELKVVLNPEYVIALMQAIIKSGATSEHCMAVEFNFYADPAKFKSSAVRVRAVNANEGREFNGILMPLTIDG